MLAAAVAAVALPACTGNCATYVVTVVVQDQTTGNLLCDAHVTFGVGDAGVTLDASVAPFDAEVAPSSSVCQWDVITAGGTYEVTASAPGFATGTATLELSKDQCGTSAAPVTVVLARS
jgi:hypothetical protein